MDEQAGLLEDCFQFAFGPESLAFYWFVYLAVVEYVVEQNDEGLR